MIPGIDLDALLKTLVVEVDCSELPTWSPCQSQHPDACHCAREYLNLVLERMGPVKSTAMETGNYAVGVVWLSQVLNETSLPLEGWPHHRYTLEGSFGWFLAMYLPTTYLSQEVVRVLAAEAVDHLTRLIDDSRGREDGVDEGLLYARFRLLRDSLGVPAHEALAPLRQTFGREGPAWHSHADVVFEYATAFLDGDRSAEGAELAVLLAEVETCIDHCTNCPGHDTPAWLGPLHTQAAAIGRLLAESCAVNHRLEHAIRARQHLLAVLTLDNLPEPARATALIEWGALHRMPQSRTRHQEFLSQELPRLRSVALEASGWGAVTQIEALSRRGSNRDAAEAERLLAHIDVSTLDASAFNMLLTIAGPISVRRMKVLQARAVKRTKKSYTFEDIPERLIHEWRNAGRDVAPHHGVTMARNWQRLAEASMVQAHWATAGVYAQEALTGLRSLPSQRDGCDAARALVEVLLKVYEQLDGLGLDVLIDSAEWMLEVTPLHWYYRAEAEWLTAAVLTRAVPAPIERIASLTESALERFQRRGDDKQVANMATEAAMALGASRDPKHKVRVQALMHQLRGGEEGHRITSPRTLMALAQCDRYLALIHPETNDLGVAVRYQSAALRAARRLSGNARVAAIASITTATFRVSRDDFPMDAQLLTDTLLDFIAAPVAIHDALEALRTLINGVGSMCDLDDAISGATHAWEKIYNTSSHLYDSRPLLAKIQGWAYHLADLLAQDGRFAESAIWLEQGSAIATRHLLIRRAASTGQQPGLWATAAVYLVARDRYGWALVWDGGDVHCHFQLPDLNRESVATWATGLSSESTRDEALQVRDLTARSAPPAEIVTKTLTEMAAAVAPLTNALERKYPSLDDWVLCGELSGLPWTAALTTSHATIPVPRVHPSLASRQNAQERARGRLDPTGVRAFTNPSPCTPRGQGATPDLPGATREGAWLGQHVDALHFDGPMATRRALELAVNQENKVLHLAMHGSIEPGSAGSKLFLADNNEAESEVFTTHDFDNAKGFARLIWIGACWGGRPNDLLPDESHGLVTSALRGLGSTVIAPLWPVDDTIAAEFAEAFYSEWLQNGATIEEAFSRALHWAQSIDVGSSWAAFTLSGAGSSKREKTDSGLQGHD